MFPSSPLHPALTAQSLLCNLTLNNLYTYNWLTLSTFLNSYHALITLLFIQHLVDSYYVSDAVLLGPRVDCNQILAEPMLYARCGARHRGLRVKETAPLSSRSADSSREDRQEDAWVTPGGECLCASVLSCRRGQLSEGERKTSWRRWHLRLKEQTGIS